MADFSAIVFRGDTPTLEFIFTEEPSGLPIDLSGWTLYFAARTKRGTVFVNKQMTIVDAAGGKAQVYLLSTETNIPGEHLAEVEARREGDVITLAQGDLIIEEDIRS